MYSLCISDYLIQDVWVRIHFHYIKVVITCICMLVNLQSKPLFPEHAHVKRGLSCGKRRRKETKRSFLKSASSLSLFHQKPISCEKKKETNPHTCVHRGWSLTLREVREVSTCRYTHLRKPVNRSHVFSVLHDTCSSGLWHGCERNSLWARVTLPLVHRTHGRAQRCPTTQANTDLGFSGAAEGLWLKFVLSLKD